jgi:5-methylcytosine-specific restriction endonuclease McrA
MPGKRPAWQGSNRRLRLPADWSKPGGPRNRVLNRPGGRVCALKLPDVCVGHATEVDHIKRGDDHSDSNLQPACQPCHARKSALEGAAARPREKRPPKAHPALR